MKPVQAINHIGIAVHSLADETEFYSEVLGAVFEGIEEVPSQKVRVAFFRIGDVRLELLEPTDPESAVGKFLATRGPGLHHVAYSVENIEERLKELKEAGLRLIDESPRTGAHHMKIAFLHPKSTKGVLTEFCEPKQSS